MKDTHTQHKQVAVSTDTPAVHHLDRLHLCSDEAEGGRCGEGGRGRRSITIRTLTKRSGVTVSDGEEPGGNTQEGPRLDLPP